MAGSQDGRSNDIPPPGGVEQDRLDDEGGSSASTDEWRGDDGRESLSSEDEDASAKVGETEVEVEDGPEGNWADRRLQPSHRWKVYGCRALSRSRSPRGIAGTGGADSTESVGWSDGRMDAEVDCPALTAVRIVRRMAAEAEGEVERIGEMLDSLSIEVSKLGDSVQVLREALSSPVFSTEGGFGGDGGKVYSTL